MKLLKSVPQARGMSLILITHDLRLAFSTCDRIHVLYAGSLLEVGDTRSVEPDPFHPYTLGLLLSEPPADRRVPKLIAIRGQVPRADLERTLNMGVGFVAMLPADQVEAATRVLEARGIPTWVIGEVTGAEDAPVDSGHEVVRGAKGVEGGAVQLVGDHPTS